MINKDNIGNYKIVYECSPLRYDFAAKQIKEKINKAFGVELECEYGAFDGGCVIYVGRADVLTGEKADVMSYTMKSVDESVAIACGGVYSALCAADKLVALLEEGSEDLSKSEALLSLERLPLTEGSDLRVMTSNILADRWPCGGRPGVLTRAEIYAAHLIKYAPEIVGVQETDMPWVELFPAYLDIIREEYGINYAWDQYLVDGVANLTSILYLKDRFAMKEHGMREFSYFKHVKYKLRVLTWAVFADAQTEKICALVNTHWSGNKEQSAIEIVEENYLVRDLETRYNGIRIFCTGDFNMHGNFAFEPFKEATGLIDAKEAADEAGTLVNRLTGIGGNIYIDHVFLNRPMKVTRYETVDNHPAHVLSDHLPQYGDFKL